MATLTETAFYTRRIVKFGIIGIVAFIVLKFSLSVGVSIWRQLKPPASPPPTVAFGKLSSLEFPSIEKPENLSFKLETATGQLPFFADRANVYFMPFKRANLMALENAKKEALKMGFIDEPEALSDKLYRWTKEGDSTTTLEMDTISGFFTLAYDWEHDPAILLEKTLPGEQQAIQEVQAFLRNIGRLGEDILTGEGKVTYLSARWGEVTPAVSLSEANFVRVDLFRKSIDSFEAVTAQPGKGIISFVLSGATIVEKRIIKIECNYSPINYDVSSSYPLKSSQTAWQELQNGNAFIPLWKEENNSAVIRRIYLAYYDSFKPQNFFQPIYVFEGDNDFLAYLPAVTPDWQR